MNLQSVPTGKCLRIFGDPVIHAVYIETFKKKKDSENFVWDSHCLLYVCKIRPKTKGGALSKPPSLKLRCFSREIQTRLSELDKTFVV